MNKAYELLRATFIILIVYSVSVSAARAGSGTYTAGTPDTIDLHVQFMYNETCFPGKNCTDWEKLFKEASKLLYDATQKQVKFSKIYFYNNCPEVSQKSDVKIHNDNRGASANTGGLGTAGRDIWLGQGHKIVTTAGAGDRGQLGLVHELGHYVFAILDEYLDKSGASTADAFCVVDNAGITSIMDGGTTVAATNQRTEWCWSGNHRTGKTNQDKKRKIGTIDYEDKDCWTFLKAFVKNKYGADLTLPTADPASDTSGHVDPTFEYFDCGVRSVVCIDRSGSMSSDSAVRSFDGSGQYEGSDLALNSPPQASPISLAKQGAKNFINVLADTDRAAVTSYSSSAGVNYAMNVMNAANKTAAKSAISLINASGLTNIGGGLQVSLDQITGDGDRLSNEFIILLSDGQHNTGTDPSAVLPALKTRGVTVHTIGLGNVDASLMSNIASQTGGTYLFANSSAQMNSHFIQMLKDARNNGLVEKLEEEMPANGNATHSVFIDSSISSNSAQFILSWDDPSIEFVFSLFRPNGSQVSGSDSDVTFTYDADAGYKEYEISTPAQGDWSVQLSNPAATSSNYTFQVHAAPSDVMFNASSDKGDYDASSENAILTSSVSTGGNNVGDATVTAEVTRPNGNPVNIAYYDNGSNLHGDDIADDGIYSSTFDLYNGSGSYTFDVTVNTEGGRTVAGGEDGVTFTSTPVDKFTRKSQFSVVVSGATTITEYADVKANNIDSPITITAGSNLTITITYEAGFQAGMSADWWMVAKAPFPAPNDWYYYNLTSGWEPGFAVTAQATLKDVASFQVLSLNGLPAGIYTFYFGTDTIMNGTLDAGQATYDSVQIVIAGGTPDSAIDSNPFK